MSIIFFSHSPFCSKPVLLENHIVTGTYYSLGLPGTRLQSVAGEKLNFTSKPGMIYRCIKCQLEMAFL